LGALVTLLLYTQCMQTVANPPIPQKHLSFESLQEVNKYVNLLRARGYQQHGNWSLAETLDHLKRTLQLMKNKFATD